MPERRIAIEVVFEDDFAVLDFQEKGWDTELVAVVGDFIGERLQGRARGTNDYLVRNNQTGEWRSYGLARPPRPSEEAMAALDRKEHPDKTRWQLARERPEKVEADRAERRRKDAEYLAMMEEAEETESEQER
jgi:hypothetical protein